jgi:hypothetical protein
MRQINKHTVSWKNKAEQHSDKEHGTTDRQRLTHNQEWIGKRSKSKLEK